MFSKALFKQSWKANKTMWSIITFAVCFMLSCVMLISGNGNISEVKNSIQDTIIQEEINAQLEKRAINYYEIANDGLAQFDGYLKENISEELSYLLWLQAKPDQNQITNLEEYNQALLNWKEKEPIINTNCGKNYVLMIEKWQFKMPNKDSYSSISDYEQAINSWKEQSPLTQEKAVENAYVVACEDIIKYENEKAIELGYETNSLQAQELIGSVMYTINPNGMFNESFYLKYEKEKLEEYDIISIIQHIASDDFNYVDSKERILYRQERAAKCTCMFLAGNMCEQENINKIITELSTFGVNKEKYNEFGYNYETIKHLSTTAVISYKNRLDYELQVVENKHQSGIYKDENEYQMEKENVKKELIEDIASSLLTSLPQDVSSAIEEIGKADLYTLIVGSIFYKLAGLLLPIIYMIMASNNLIAGQVDSGSMAYILSTSTKRKTIIFTQAMFLIGSLFAMFSCTTIVGCICLAFVKADVSLTYKNLILLNVGAFLVLFALSGLCFLTSCYFDRSKRSMAIGGGLSIFALVAAMLGLFGSPVIPSVVRLESLNYFNYTTIISLFDVISIMENTSAFLIKFIILLTLGLLGYILGAIKFTKKDLPL